MRPVGVRLGIRTRHCFRNLMVLEDFKRGTGVLPFCPPRTDSIAESFGRSHSIKLFSIGGRPGAASAMAWGVPRCRRLSRTHGRGAPAAGQDGVPRGRAQDPCALTAAVAACIRHRMRRTTSCSCPAATGDAARHRVREASDQLLRHWRERHLLVSDMSGLQIAIIKT